MNPIDIPIDFERARREGLRWLILKTLEAASWTGTSESIVRSAVEPLVPDITFNEIREELDYLEGRELVTTERNRSVWHAKISRYGIDIVEYTVDCHPGIARPKKYW